MQTQKSFHVFPRHHLLPFRLFDKLSSLECWLICHACDLVLVISRVCIIHNFVRTDMKVSPRLSEGLSQMSDLSLSPLDSPTKGYVENMFPFQFGVSFCGVRLSVCSQGHIYMSSLAHTLSHFYEYLSTRPPSISRNSTALHCIASTLSDQSLLPKIA